MSPSFPPRVAACLGLAAVLVAGGCASAKHTFAGQDAEQVWTAMVAVARQPRYDDWTVLANDVWVDEADRRIEIHRRLDRLVAMPSARPRREQRTWELEVRLVATDPPQARFASRGSVMPAQLQAEASRFFDDVQDLLDPPALGEQSAADAPDG